jgi:hypothetical protein
MEEYSVLQIPLKHLYPSTKLHGIISQKMMIIDTAVRTSEFMNNRVFCNSDAYYTCLAKSREQNIRGKVCFL